MQCLNIFSPDLLSHVFTNTYVFFLSFIVNFEYVSATCLAIIDVVHATRQVCRPAEKTAGKKTRDMYLHFTRSNVWAIDVYVMG